jgi:hypothetical protein
LPLYSGDVPVHPPNLHQRVEEMCGMQANRLHQPRNSRVQRMLKTTLKTLAAQLADLEGC